MEEQLHKAIKGSIKLFFKQIRRRKPISSVELIGDQRVKRAPGTHDHPRTEML